MSCPVGDAHGSFQVRDAGRGTMILQEQVALVSNVRKLGDLEGEKGDTQNVRTEKTKERRELGYKSNKDANHGAYTGPSRALLYRPRV